MICPNCEQSLLRKERTGNVCGKCRRRYAMDPKTNPMKLNDLRIRRVMAKLTDQGQVPCTPGQLWYALSRKSLREGKSHLGRAGIALIIGLVLGSIGIIGDPSLAVIGGVLLLIALGIVIASALGWGRGKPRMNRNAFRSGVINQWRSVYGSLPPGMVEDDRYPTPGYGGVAKADGSGAVLLCPDLSIANFLAADGLPGRYGLTLEADLRDVRGHGPVIVLHDADPHGLLLVRRVRQAMPGRQVIDAGLPLRTVRKLKSAVPYRAGRPDKDVIAELTATGQYTADELKWLAKGWAFPLVGVPPARLRAAVTRVAEQVATATDPQRRRAASVGFLTWPGEQR
ncbi:hypothetical protein [Streptomyces sp. NPDC020681]|uniref:hypothetical protein n=1 Tax=Streptomyces sp. NPDC020681 TaxID=3365083 RepID=UPI00379601AB